MYNKVHQSHQPTIKTIRYVNNSGVMNSEVQKIIHRNNCRRISQKRFGPVQAKPLNLSSNFHSVTNMGRIKSQSILRPDVRRSRKREFIERAEKSVNKKVISVNYYKGGKAVLYNQKDPSRSLHRRTERSISVSAKKRVTICKGKINIKRINRARNNSKSVSRSRKSYNSRKVEVRASNQSELTESFKFKPNDNLVSKVQELQDEKTELITNYERLLKKYDELYNLDERQKEMSNKKNLLELEISGLRQGVNKLRNKKPSYLLSDSSRQNLLFNLKTHDRARNESHQFSIQTLSKTKPNESYLASKNAIENFSGKNHYF